MWWRRNGTLQTVDGAKLTDPVAIAPATCAAGARGGG